MNIQFCGPPVQASDGVSYRVLFDDETVTCRVSTEALQDIDPPNRFNDCISQFNNNFTALMNIAERKILNGEIEDGTVWVLTSDL